MKRMLMLGLSIVAVLAMGVMTTVASAAPAKPVYKKCVKKKDGNYTSKECLASSKVAGTGKYEIEAVAEGSHEAFKGKSGVSRLILVNPTTPSEYWKGGTKVGEVSCKSSKDKGEITGPKSAVFTDEFKTCTSEGKKCTSTNTTKKGTIITEGLATELVVLSDGSIGEKVTAKSTPLLANFECEGLHSEVSGSLLIKVTKGVEEAKKEIDVKAAANETNGAQEYNHVKGGAEGEDYLFSKVTPPGVKLPGGQINETVNKGKTQLGIFEE